jgi:3-methyladenine DNA glycosylase AlkD
MNIDEVMSRLESLSDPDAVAGMARYGIKPERALGISIPKLRKLAGELRGDHALALELWASGVHEARILAGMADDPALVSERQMEEWTSDFDSWDLCDQVCMNLYWLTPYAYDKCFEWSEREEEFVRRAAFALMARIAWTDRKATDAEIEKFLPVIVRAATDERNFVKKAVNWALRQIGKRDLPLNKRAIETALEIQRMDSRSARWIAADALKELTGDAVQARLANKS